MEGKEDGGGQGGEEGTRGRMEKGRGGKTDTKEDTDPVLGSGDRRDSESPSGPCIPLRTSS